MLKRFTLATLAAVVLVAGLTGCKPQGTTTDGSSAASDSATTTTTTSTSTTS
ncbi:MAG: hypothetical protein QM752_06800 [Gammaproteobacteria bacterium]